MEGEHLTQSKDITAPEEARELYQGILASAQTGIYIVQDGKFQYVNPQFEEYTGYKNEELMGRYSLELVHPDDREMVRREAIRRLRGEESTPYEYRVTRKDGEIRWIMERVASITYRGRPAVVGSYMDITEQKRAEEDLIKEKRFLANIKATIPDSLLVLDKDLRIKSANRTFYEVFQMESGKVIGTSITEILPDKDGKLSTELTRLFGTEDMLENFKLHYKSEKLGERVFNITARGMLIAEEEEEEEELLVLEDITDRKRAEKALEKSEEKYRTLVSNVKLGVFRSTPEPEGKFMEVNPAMEEITGYSREELLQMNVSDLYLHPEKREKVLEEIAATERGKTTRELEFKKKDG